MVLLTAVHAVEAVAGSATVRLVIVIRAPADGLGARARADTVVAGRRVVVHRIAGAGPGLGGQHAVRAGLVGLVLLTAVHAVEAVAGSATVRVFKLIRAPADGLGARARADTVIAGGRVVVHRIAGAGPGLGGQHAVRARLVGLVLLAAVHAVEAVAGSATVRLVIVIRAPADGCSTRARADTVVAGRRVVVDRISGAGPGLGGHHAVRARLVGSVLLAAVHAVEAKASAATVRTFTPIRASADGCSTRACADTVIAGGDGVVHRIAGTGPGLGRQHAVRARLVGEAT